MTYKSPFAHLDSSNCYYSHFFGFTERRQTVEWKKNESKKKVRGNGKIFVQNLDSIGNDFERRKKMGFEQQWLGQKEMDEKDRLRKTANGIK